MTVLKTYASRLTTVLKPSYRWIIFLILAGLLLTSALQAARTGLADIYHYPVKKYLKEPEKYQNTDKQELFELTTRSLTYTPNNPDMLRASARLQDLIAVERSKDHYFWEPAVDVSQDYQASLQQFTRAVRLRPVSPWLWSDIALMKAKLGEYDELMQDSLLQAAKSGPWQPLVQIQLTNTGLASWSELSADTQEVILENIRRGLHRKSRYILPIARIHNKMPLLCEKLRNTTQLSEKCSR